MRCYPRAFFRDWFLRDLHHYLLAFVKQLADGRRSPSVGPTRKALLWPASFRPSRVRPSIAARGHAIIPRARIRPSFGWPRFSYRRGVLSALHLLNFLHFLDFVGRRFLCDRDRCGDLRVHRSAIARRRRSGTRSLAAASAAAAAPPSTSRRKLGARTPIANPGFTVRFEAFAGLVIFITRLECGCAQFRIAFPSLFA